jgi:dTDP-4-amino-4,6-dideoxygalactose transaminase
MNIPFIDLKSQQTRIRDKIDAGLAHVLDHGAYIMGPEIAALESRLAEWSGATHNISCSSGTDSLLLALSGLGLKPGQGVIVPAFTFAASAEVMPVMGAIPVFAEVDPITFNIAPEQLGTALAAGRTAGIDVVGIIGVGLFGQPADYDAICQFAKAHDLWVIDDAAQSFGARWQGRKVGSLADVTCTSFFPAKPLGCYGDGGAVFTDNEAIAETIRSCRIHGMGKDKYQNVRIGMTGRLDTMQAVVLDAKLDIFADELDLRQQVADRYQDRLNAIVETPQLAAGATSSWAQYTVKLPEALDRDVVCAKLQAAGVPSAIYYPVPMHRQPPYATYPVAAGALNDTDKLCQRVIALPMHPYLDADTQDIITAALKAAL